MRYQYKKIDQFLHQIDFSINDVDVQNQEKEVVSDLFRIHISSDKTARVNTGEFLKSNQLLVQKVLQERLVSSALQKALFELNLVLAAPPSLQGISFDEKKNYKFSVFFETKPNLSGLKFEHFAIKEPIVEVSQQELDEQIFLMLGPVGEIEDQPKEYLARRYSIIFFDMDYVVDGSERSDLRMDRQALMIGTGTFKLPIDNELIGLKVGDVKKINYQLPEIFNIHELAGRKVQLVFTIKKVQEMRVPALDKQFINSHFSGKPGAPKSVQEFKDFVREMIFQRKKNELERKSKSELLQNFIRANPFDVPTSMIEMQKRLMVDHETREAQSKGRYSPPKPGSFRDQELSQKAADAVRAGLLIEYIAKSKNINVSTEDIESHLTTSAQIFGVSVDKLRQQFSTPDAVEKLKYVILEDKVLKSFLKSA